MKQIGKINTKKFGRIGVLMGGPSSERKISLKSGKAVYQALKAQGLDVVRLDIDHNASNQIKRAKINCAFIALHGKFGEDGRIQEILESLNIPYTGSGVTASYLCLDKPASRRILKQHQIPVPKYEILSYRSWRKQLKELKLKFPLVVKPSSEGSSIGITFVEQPAKLSRAVKYAFNYDQTVIVEQYISGREITVGILNERPLPVVEIVPKQRFFDFCSELSNYCRIVPQFRMCIQSIMECHNGDIIFEN